MVKTDMNGDGLLTISDVVMWFEWLWEGVVWLFFLPGDTVIWLLMVYTPGLAIFLELSVEFYSGWMAGILSVITWFFFSAITSDVFD